MRPAGPEEQTPATVSTQPARPPDPSQGERQQLAAGQPASQIGAGPPCRLSLCIRTAHGHLVAKAVPRWTDQAGRPWQHPGLGAMPAPPSLPAWPLPSCSSAS